MTRAPNLLVYLWPLSSGDTWKLSRTAGHLNGEESFTAFKR